MAVIAAIILATSSISAFAFGVVATHNRQDHTMMRGTSLDKNIRRDSGTVDCRELSNFLSDLQARDGSLKMLEALANEFARYCSGWQEQQQYDEQRHLQEEREAREEQARREQRQLQEEQARRQRTEEAARQTIPPAAQMNQVGRPAPSFALDHAQKARLIAVLEGLQPFSVAILVAHLGWLLIVPRVSMPN